MWTLNASIYTTINSIKWMNIKCIDIYNYKSIKWMWTLNASIYTTIKYKMNVNIKCINIYNY